MGGRIWAQAEDETSSDETAGARAGPRAKRLEAERRRRRRRGGDWVQIDLDVASRLEQNAVLSSTNQVYAAPVTEFLKAMESEYVALRSDEEIDKKLVRKLNQEYLQGREVSRANHLLAGWRHSLPEFGKAGKRRIPRSLLGSARQVASTITNYSIYRNL